MLIFIKIYFHKYIYIIAFNFKIDKSNSKFVLIN